MHHQGFRRPDHTTEHLSDTLPTLTGAAEDRRFRSIFEQAAAGMACMDGNGYVQQMNLRFCQILGHEYEELLQQGFLDITHPDDVRADLAYLRATLMSSAIKPYIRETRYLRKDGSFVWVALTLSPVYLGKVFDCFVCTIEDISQRKQLEEQLLLSEQQAISRFHQLEQVNKVQIDFIAVVSHEFRTTLTGIQGFSELLRDEDFDVAEFKDYANDINMDALRLNRMISELLDLERMKSGKMSLHLSKIDINTILQEVAERMVLIAPDHILNLDTDESLPQLEGDYDRLMQLVTNLVSNAVKYSPAHSMILLKSFQEDDNVHIIVQDQGIGIPEASLEAIFAPHSRIYTAKTRYIQGTGLGLAIVQQIVQMHEGRISVESKLGHGSTFHVTLPMKNV